MTFPTSETNSPARSGQPASSAMYLDGHRYKLQAIHTRFDAVAWFVVDAEKVDDVTGLPAVIRQEATPAAAVATLPTLEVER